MEQCPKCNTEWRFDEVQMQHCGTCGYNEITAKKIARKFLQAIKDPNVITAIASSILKTKVEVIIEPDCKAKALDEAKTCVQILCNATGAEFEDELLAAEIIAETILNFKS